MIYYEQLRDLDCDRKAEQRKAAMVELRRLLAEGEASGIGTKTMAEIKAEARAELGL